VTANTATTFDECIAVTGAGSPSPPPAKADNTATRWRGATPFTVYAQFDCSPVGLDRARDKAEEALARGESYQIERAFWTGQAAGTNNIAFPHLAHTGQEIPDAQGILLQSPVVTGGGAYPITQGLGVLEGLMADCLNGQGVVHVPPRVLPKLAGAMAVTARGGTLTTSNGNLIAVGNGYPGTSPLGQAAATGEAWIYGTGPVVVYRSEPQFSRYGAETLDRTENTIRLLAERTALVAWDCCHFAVLINLTV
jgi:hypothetical protein